jgi:hypothetical protein
LSCLIASRWRRLGWPADHADGVGAAAVRLDEERHVHSAERVVVAKKCVSIRCPERIGAVLPLDWTWLLPDATAHPESVLAGFPAAGDLAVGLYEMPASRIAFETRNSRFVAVSARLASARGVRASLVRRRSRSGSAVALSQGRTPAPRDPQRHAVPHGGLPQLPMP